MTITVTNNKNVMYKRTVSKSDFEALKELAENYYKHADTPKAHDYAKADKLLPNEPKKTTSKASKTTKSEPKSPKYATYKYAHSKKGLVQGKRYQIANIVGDYLELKGVKGKVMAKCFLVA